MKNITLQRIRWENIRCIFDIISKKGTVSRAELAEKTNLSLVTVGKTADVLLENQIVCQTKEARNTVGRRAGSLSVNEKMYILVFDLSKPCYTSIVYDLRLQEMNRFEYTDTTHSSVDKRLSSLFATTAKNVFESREPDDCCGIGICLSNRYKTNAFDADQETVTYILNEHFFGFPYIIDSFINAAAFSAIQHIDSYEDKSVLFFDLTEDHNAGAFFTEGTQLLGKNGRFCEFCEIKKENGNPPFALGATDAVTFAKSTAPCFANLIRVLSPHTIVLHSPLSDPEKDLFPLLNQLLTEEHSLLEADLPDFLAADPMHYRSDLGVAMKVREEWLKTLLYNE